MTMTRSEDVGSCHCFGCRRFLGRGRRGTCPAAPCLPRLGVTHGATMSSVLCTWCRRLAWVGGVSVSATAAVVAPQELWMLLPCAESAERSTGAKITDDDSPLRPIVLAACRAAGAAAMAAALPQGGGAGAAGGGGGLAAPEEEGGRGPGRELRQFQVDNKMVRTTTHRQRQQRRHTLSQLLQEELEAAEKELLVLVASPSRVATSLLAKFGSWLRELVLESTALEAEVFVAVIEEGLLRKKHDHDSSPAAAEADAAEQQNAPKAVLPLLDFKALQHAMGAWARAGRPLEAARVFAEAWVCAELSQK